MIAKRTATATLIIGVIALLAVLAFHVRIGATADSVAVLKTTGMTCGSCSGKISKALEAMQGVAITEVDVSGGLVVVGYDTRLVKAEALAEKIIAAGFGSKLQAVLTPEQFKNVTGREIGKSVLPAGGCGGCGPGNGCGSQKKT